MVAVQHHRSAVGSTHQDKHYWKATILFGASDVEESGMEFKIAWRRSMSTVQPFRMIRRRIVLEVMIAWQRNDRIIVSDKTNQLLTVIKMNLASESDDNESAPKSDAAESVPHGDEAESASGRYDDESASETYVDDWFFM